MTIYLYITGMSLEQMQHEVVQRLDALRSRHQCPATVVNQREDDHGEAPPLWELGLNILSSLDAEQDRALFLDAVTEMRDICAEQDCEVAVGVAQGEVADDVDYIDADTEPKTFVEDFLRVFNGS